MADEKSEKEARLNYTIQHLPESSLLPSYLWNIVDENSARLLLSKIFI